MFANANLRRFVAITVVSSSLALGLTPQGSASEAPTHAELREQLAEWAEANGMRGLSPASLTSS